MILNRLHFLLFLFHYGIFGKSDTPVSANGIVVSIACSKVICVSIMAYLIPYADTKLVPGGPAGPCIPRGP